MARSDKHEASPEVVALLPNFTVLTLPRPWRAQSDANCIASRPHFGIHSPPSSDGLPLSMKRSKEALECDDAVLLVRTQSASDAALRLSPSSPKSEHKLVRRRSEPQLRTSPHSSRSRKGLRQLPLAFPLQRAKEPHSRDDTSVTERLLPSSPVTSMKLEGSTGKPILIEDDQDDAMDVSAISAAPAANNTTFIDLETMTEIKDKVVVNLERTATLQTRMTATLSSSSSLAITTLVSPAKKLHATISGWLGVPEPVKEEIKEEEVERKPWFGAWSKTPKQRYAAPHYKRVPHTSFLGPLLFNNASLSLSPFSGRLQWPLQGPVQARLLPVALPQRSLRRPLALLQPRTNLCVLETFLEFIK